MRSVYRGGVRHCFQTCSLCLRGRSALPDSHLRIIWSPLRNTPGLEVYSVLVAPLHTPITPQPVQDTRNHDCASCFESCEALPQSIPDRASSRWTLARAHRPLTLRSLLGGVCVFLRVWAFGVQSRRLGILYFCFLLSSSSRPGDVPPLKSPLGSALSWLV